MSKSIQDLINEASQSGTRRSKYLDRLTPEQREVLDKFVVWLEQVDGKSPVTAKAYKGYVAQALCHGLDGGALSELSTDIRSGVNALARFQKQFEPNDIVQDYDEYPEEFDPETYEAPLDPEDSEDPEEFEA